MKSFVVSLLIVGAAAMLPQGAQAQQVAQSMPGMEQKGGGEAKPDTAKTGGMSCCCSKKEETTKKSEQPIR